jgi:L-ascorbate metabolism protein UlaG (beta-lactamase superfamily)
MKVYIGGDSGYDTHYSEIGKQFGPIDVAILDNGQYDLKWRYIHTLPEEVIQAAADLKARRLFPVHSSKFMMANHPWDEPLIKITALNAASSHPLPLITPIIGEYVNLRDTVQKFKQWWVGLE